MSTMLTVRIDETRKKNGSEVFRREGYTISSAVQALFDYAIKYDKLPFDKNNPPEADEVERRMSALRDIRMSCSSPYSDEDVRAMRIGERYGIDV